MDLQNLASSACGAVEIFFGQQSDSVFEKLRFAPAPIRLRPVGQQDPSEGKAEKKKSDADGQPSWRELQSPAANSLHSASSPDASNMLSHCANPMRASTRECNCRR